MAAVINITPEQRKSFWRGSRRLFWSGLGALAIALALGVVKLETVAKFSAATIILVGLWIGVYHLIEYVKKR